MTEFMPRYRVLAEEIRKDYLGGSSRPGDRLPPEAEFCRRFGVARGTVIKAIETLMAEGAVVRKQGAGTFVSDPGLRRRHGSVESFSQSMGLDRETSHRVLSVEPLSDKDVRALGMTESMMRLTRLRLLDGAPVALHASAVPESLFELMRAHDPEVLLPGNTGKFSLYEALAGVGHPVVRASERNVARLATGEEAELLQARLPAAVMEVWRTSRDAAGRVVDATRAVYLSGQYSVDIELARPWTAN